jgi:hypothetical protein
MEEFKKDIFKESKKEKIPAIRYSHPVTTTP